MSLPDRPAMVNTLSAPAPTHPSETCKNNFNKTNLISLGHNSTVTLLQNVPHNSRVDLVLDAMHENVEALSAQRTGLIWEGWVA